jgi:C4-dicarboxylate-specific signal transduction histidine kinase
MFEWSNTLVQKDDGTMDYIATIGIDITQKEIDQANIIEQKAKLAKLNATLEQKVLEKIDQIRQKDKLLYQQAKMASMGEMIGNIAHQWRQPLTALSTLIIEHSLQYDFGKLNDESMHRFQEKSNTFIQKMSATIDDFRNFFLPNKNKELFSIKNVIEESLKFVQDSFRAHAITLENNIDTHIEIMGYKNELIQAILNILNNSKDALISSKIDDPQVTITLTKEQNHAKIVITDNAGGIDEDIIDKIFEPYFTTKFQDQGTGIGLYMTKMIIKESMGGDLKITNINGGVQATIILPLDF